MTPIGSEPAKIETPPQFLPPSRRLPPIQGLEAPTFDVSDNSLDEKYTSREDMIQDVEDYTSASDFEANNPAEPLFPVPAWPEDSSPGGVTLQGTPSSSASVPVPAPETVPAPAPAPEAPQASATGTNRYAMQPGVTRAIIRGLVRSTVATDYRANRNNGAAVAGFAQKDTLQQVHKLGFHANLDIAHQLDDTFTTEYTYAKTNTQGSFSAWEIKEKIKPLLNKLKNQHMHHFEMTDMGDASRVRGMNVKP